MFQILPCADRGIRAEVRRPEGPYRRREQPHDRPRSPDPEEGRRRGTQERPDHEEPQPLNVRRKSRTRSWSSSPRSPVALSMRGHRRTRHWTAPRRDPGATLVERRSRHQGRTRPGGVGGNEEAGPPVQDPQDEEWCPGITLPDVVVEALREHRCGQLELRLALGVGKLPDDALVFSGPEGAPQSPRDLSTDWAVEADRPGLGAVTFHALRHTCISVDRR